jgi:hypothetical protein
MKVLKVSKKLESAIQKHKRKRALIYLVINYDWKPLIGEGRIVGVYTNVDSAVTHANGLKNGAMIKKKVKDLYIY